MNRDDASDFLNAQRIETLLQNPPPGEKVMMMAVLVDPGTLARLEHGLEQVDSVELAKVMLTTDRHENLRLLAAAKPEALGVISAQIAHGTGVVNFTVRPRSKHETTEVVIELLQIMQQKWHDELMAALDIDGESSPLSSLSTREKEVLFCHAIWSTPAPDIQRLFDSLLGDEVIVLHLVGKRHDGTPLRITLRHDAARCEEIVATDPDAVIGAGATATKRTYADLMYEKLLRGVFPSKRSRAITGDLELGRRETDAGKSSLFSLPWWLRS